jgi:hypothetical protein
MTKGSGATLTVLGAGLLQVLLSMINEPLTLTLPLFCLAFKKRPNRRNFALHMASSSSLTDHALFCFDSPQPPLQWIALLTAHHRRLTLDILLTGTPLGLGKIGFDAFVYAGSLAYCLRGGGRSQRLLQHGAGRCGGPDSGVRICFWQEYRGNSLGVWPG